MTENNELDKPTPSTKALLRKLEETRDIGTHTLEELNTQGETLGRIQSLNEQHTQTLKGADWHLKKLSVRGRISTLFKKKPTSVSSQNKSEKKQQPKLQAKETPPSPAVNTTANTKKVEEKLTEEDLIWRPELQQQKAQQQPQLQKTQPSSQQAPSNPLYDDELLAGMTQEQRATLEEQDQDLDMMSSVLADLKQISMKTNTELVSQGTKIDQIHSQVDQNSYVLQKTNIKLGARLR